MRTYLFLLLLLAGFTQNCFAQDSTVTPLAQDTINIVHILNADRYSFKKVDSLSELMMMAGHVRLKQDSTVFEADSAVYNKSQKIVEAFGNIHINDRDSVHTYSQYLLYHVDTKVAILKKKVKLTDNSTQLFTEELEYDMNQKIGIYRNGGRVLTKNSVLTSREATYYAELKDVYFRNNVKLKDPAYDLQADSLLYNTNAQLATFITKTTIKDSTRKIVTSEGFYDLKNKNAVFGARPVIQDGAVTVIANEIETDDVTGISKLRGTALFKDTAQGISILANYIESDKLKGSFFATEHPLMILRQEKDSIYITADTLLSGRVSTLLQEQKHSDSIAAANIRLDTIATDTATVKDSLAMVRAQKSVSDSTFEITDTIRVMEIADVNSNDTTNRYFKAFSHVRIFSDSLQAVADSLFYSGADSVFKLFKQPVVWASGSQVVGDTIYLYTKNKKPDKMLVFENGLLINESAKNLFNQVAGTTLFGYFKNGEIDYVRSRGNAESVYYVKDDAGRMFGVNKASGDIIDMRFINKELNKVTFIRDVKGTMYPVRKFPAEEQFLRGFKWQEDRRPKTKYELFGD
jgi:lipopolysaccharide export system protein LptA